jgi:hypothetical protein
MRWTSSGQGLSFPRMTLAHSVLAIHFAIIIFNVVGLIVIPLGGLLGWPFVRERIWRILHLVSWGAVALQAVAGRACFLTDWQHELAGGEGNAAPLIARIVNAVIYWPLPLWVFAIIYAAIFALVLGLFWIVPIRPASR